MNRPTVRGPGGSGSAEPRVLGAGPSAPAAGVGLRLGSASAPARASGSGSGSPRSPTRAGVVHRGRRGELGFGQHGRVGRRSPVRRPGPARLRAVRRRLLRAPPPRVAMPALAWTPARPGRSRLRCVDSGSSVWMSASSSLMAAALLQVVGPVAGRFSGSSRIGVEPARRARAVGRSRAGGRPGSCRTPERRHPGSATSPSGTRPGSGG